MTRKHCQTGCFLDIKLHDTTSENAAKSVELTHVSAEKGGQKLEVLEGNGRESEKQTK